MGEMAEKKLLYIETVGCQMNMLDSELVVASLRQQGYDLTDAPESATTILFNTCSVRQHAEDKIYSALGKLRRLKQSYPDKVIGVMGCMAQKDQRRIFDRAPYVDLIVGPGQLHQVPELIERVQGGAGRQVEVSLDRTAGSLEQIKRSHESFDPLRDPSMRPSPWQAYVRIQIGCDKFCTYCIVPMVRGPEQGRPPEQIVAEARALADQGCREITLLGQTVNSYRYRENGKSTRLSDLLLQLHEIPGIDRLKFVTNYPKDMTDDLLRAVRDLPKCSPYLHVPAQSGSNRMLAAMKRGYTVEEYREMMQRIRATIPDAAVSSDFIVGFSGETEDDFRQTVELVEECRFKNSFIFKYSERPGTKGAEMLPDDVSDDNKRRRNNELLAVQNRISAELNEAMVGEEVEILVEGPSKAARDRGDAGPVLQMTGRTHCDRIVVYDGNIRQAGQLVQVVIYDAHSHTLFGEIVTSEVRHDLHSIS
ncbi:MAG: tRNA (N6-isopentenyl adenosine(37)-C2)-methylthiotransferase MiaB [Planctomycetales bacterium]|nr:tRNA (N6-isopentenyl adenosine(37)-C2)-methylthiotransferase MiaB [Planctomycetales bacterium]